MSECPWVAHVGTFVAVATALGIASYGSSHSVSSALAVGIVSGLVAAVGMRYLRRGVTARLEALGLEEGHFPPEVSSTVLLRGDVQEVLAALRQAIEQLPNFGTITESDLDAGIVRCRTRRSRQSWGENISAKVETEGFRVRLSLRSEPVLWTVTEDMLFNYQNVVLIVKQLGEIFELDTVEPAYIAAAVKRKFARAEKSGQA